MAYRLHCVSSMKRLLVGGLGSAILLAGAHAVAKPVATGGFCAEYPGAPSCKTGSLGCPTCHVKTEQPAAWNVYGEAVRAELLPGAPRPLSDADFMAGLPDALSAVEALDSDGDGYANLDEIVSGTLPGDKASHPDAAVCRPDPAALIRACEFDARSVYRKLHIDACGQSPSYEDLEAFRALPASEQPAALDAALSACLESEFWRGKNGVLWQLAHRKIRPVGSLKAGEDDVPGGFPIADYYNDYELFVYTQIDHHDARDVLLADYFVDRVPASGGEPTRYVQVDELPGTEQVDVAHRVGLLTTQWNLLYNVMFTALPRTAAAQAYRAFLGFELARYEGLYPVPDDAWEDYDNKGVKANPDCAACHSTIDPATWAFSRYNGFQFPLAAYDPDRLEDDFTSIAPGIGDTPEAGWLLGKPVADLREWAEVAANSDEFAMATVRDYWMLFIGRAPTAEEADEFEALWKGLRGKNAWSVERVLADLIKTEAYGVP